MLTELSIRYKEGGEERLPDNKAVASLETMKLNMSIYSNGNPKILTIIENIIDEVKRRDIDLLILSDKLEADRTGECPHRVVKRSIQKMYHNKLMTVETCQACGSILSEKIVE